MDRNKAWTQKWEKIKYVKKARETSDRRSNNYILELQLHYENEQITLIEGIELSTNMLLDLIKGDLIETITNNVNEEIYKKELTEEVAQFFINP